MTSSGASYVWLCSAYFYPTLFYQLRFHFVGFRSPTDRLESDHLLWKGFYWIMFLLQFHSSFNRIVASDIDIFPDSHASISEGFCLRLCLFKLIWLRATKLRLVFFYLSALTSNKLRLTGSYFFLQPCTEGETKLLGENWDWTRVLSLTTWRWLLKDVFRDKS